MRWHHCVVATPNAAQSADGVDAPRCDVHVWLVRRPGAAAVVAIISARRHARSIQRSVLHVCAASISQRRPGPPAVPRRGRAQRGVMCAASDRRVWGMGRRRRTRQAPSHTEGLMGAHVSRPCPSAAQHTGRHRTSAEPRGPHQRLRRGHDVGGRVESMFVDRGYW